MEANTLGMRINSSLHEIYLGRTKAFLIEASDGSFLLVDAGMPNSYKTIIAYINSLGKSVSDIKYILLTHAHIDHFGGAYYMQRLSGAHLAIHEKGIQYIDGASGLMLPKQGNVKGIKPALMAGMIKLMIAFARPKFVKPDMVLKEGMFPEQMRVKAKILETPGHTPDSISIYLPDSNTVIVGDLLRGVPEGLRVPIFYDDYISLLSSIKKVKDLNPDLVCVSHGKDHNISNLNI